MNGNEIGTESEEWVKTVYTKIKDALLSMPEVVELTSGGMQYFIAGISKAFGRTAEKGMEIHKGSDYVTVDVSAAIREGFNPYDTAVRIQEKVKSIINETVTVPQCFVNVTITRIVFNEVSNE